MNSTPVSKYVIGVALLAVFGTVAYMYAVRDAQRVQAAQAQPTPPAPPPPVASSPTVPDVVASAPAPVTAPAVTAPVAAPSVAQNDAATSQPKHHRTRTPADDSVTKADTAAAPAAPVATAAPVANAEPVANAAPVPAAPVPDTAAVAPEAGASDSRISADVKSQIASAAPNSNVNVSTTHGSVALTGSVASQDAVDQAKQAALRVPGVKTVDTSGLLVSNQ